MANACVTSLARWLLALVLAVWALWILDPIVRLGHSFYLGDLFHYEGPGFWFGLPLGSQLGFTATTAILLGTLFAMTHGEPARPVDGVLHHPRFPELLTYNAQVVHLVIVCVRDRRFPSGHDRWVVLLDVDSRRRRHRLALEPSPRRPVPPELLRAYLLRRS